LDSRLIKQDFLSVADALERVLAPVVPLPEEDVALHKARGRTLARDLAALRTQPPTDVSAMDGYALRFADLSKPLTLVGESAAGRRYDGVLEAGETVRIFTGAPVPEGADTVLIQEMALADGTSIIAQEQPAFGRNIRKAGLDFADGDVLLTAGTRLGASELALAAAMNHATVPVVRKPLVAIIATGDELVAPGEPVGPDQIVASNSFAIAAFVEESGGEALDLGIVADTMESLEAAIRRARDAKADVLITLGGASVGDHDLVKPALAKEGMQLGFWRIAMRPGKPLIHGRLGAMSILGLPGNPVSSIVCGVLFLMPLVRALSGDRSAGADMSEPAVTGAPLPANDKRQDYLRATLHRSETGVLVATPNRLQDSSMLRVLAEAECLLIRGPNATADDAGAPCRILRLRH
jgi:molybdopterin molybdotransferase